MLRQWIIILGKYDTLVGDLRFHNVCVIMRTVTVCWSGVVGGGGGRFTFI